MFNRPFHKHFFQFERPPRLFEKGDLKYVILDLLKDKPSHGYEIIRAIEDSFYGLYTPSAGSVYPTLQMLDDLGHVSSSERDGKKIYAITEEGKRFLDEQQEVIDKIKVQIKDWWHPRDIGEFHDIMHEIRNLGRFVGRSVHQLKPDKWARIKEVVTRACRDIEEIIEKE
jgi:DNA-binding PadR family transcriptional regulator